MIRVTKLSRDQIAEFAKNPQQIKYFEALQTNVSELPEAIAILTTAVAEAQADADIAVTSANEALTLANQKTPDDFLPEMVMQPIGGGDAISAATVGASTKATPVDADLIPLIDSAAGYTLKNLTWANLKATLKTYFDSVAQTFTNKTINLTDNTLIATSAQLAAALTDETGTGAAVFASSPALAGVPTAPTAAAGTNTTQIATTAFVNNAITGPSFAAWQSTLQSVPNATFTKLEFQTEEWDTATAFDSATNYRFTPLVAGYYQVSGTYQSASAINGQMLVAIYKNGAVWKQGNQVTANSNLACTISALVFLNGSTDYVELFGFQASGVAVNSQALQQCTWFQAALVRAA